MKELSQSQKDAIISDTELPEWFRILHLEDDLFERSKYAAPTHSESKGKHRLKDLNILRKIAPNTYETAAQEVKEYSDALFEHKGVLKKYNLGRKLGSIPLMDMTLHPELANDPAAQDKYFKEHPELKV